MFTSPYPIRSMYAIYGVPWIPSIYPLYVSIYTSTMDPSWECSSNSSFNMILMGKSQKFLWAIDKPCINLQMFINI